MNLNMIVLKYKYAQKAIEEYNNLINYEYAFLHANIERLQSAVNSVKP